MLSSFSSHESYVMLDLLMRGNLSKLLKEQLKIALAEQDINFLKSLKSKYDLKSKGIDNRECIVPLLTSLGFLLEESEEGYSILPTIPVYLIKYPNLIGTYRHVSQVGDALRALEAFPGEKGLEFIQLYSWGLKTYTPNLTKTQVNVPTVPDVDTLDTLLTKTSKNKVSKSKVKVTTTTSHMRSKNVVLS
jgi:hypothetical protein